MLNKIAKYWSQFNSYIYINQFGEIWTDDKGWIHDPIGNNISLALIKSKDRPKFQSIMSNYVSEDVETQFIKYNKYIKLKSIYDRGWITVKI